jgi:L-fucose mutarotase
MKGCCAQMRRCHIKTRPSRHPSIAEPMLKNIPAVLSPDLLKTLRAMGHGDEIAIVDGNYPADAHGRRILRADGVSATDLLDAILTVMPLDDFVDCAVFRPAPRGAGASDDQPIFRDFRAILDKHEGKKAKMERLEAADFYQRVKECYAVVASSEARLYGNVVLKKGVIRPK